MALAMGEDAPDDDASQVPDLDDLYERRATIDLTLEFLRQRAASEEADRLRTEFERERAEWVGAARKRVLAALALQRANAEFESFRRKYAALGVLPTAGIRLLGYGEIAGNEITRAAEELVSSQIITKREAGFE